LISSRAAFLVAFLGPPNKSVILYEFASVNKLNLHVVKLFSAIRRNMSFFVDHQKATLFKLVSDCVYRNLTDGKGIEAGRLLDAVC
jgi:hypothetical protein